LKNIRTYLILISLFTKINLFGQEKRFVEEIALYHLDSLIKFDKTLKFFKYFTNGWVNNEQTTTADTSQIIEKTLILKSTFKNLSLIENKNLKAFSVPKKIRKNSKDPGLSIYRFIKNNDLYYILFESIDDGSLGQVLIIINKTGDLVRYKYSLIQI